MTRYNKNIVKAYITKAPVTSLFIAINTLFFTIQLLMCFQSQKSCGIQRISYEVLDTLGGNIPKNVKGGQLYRLITAMILHGGVFHWLMNTASMIGFCASIEAGFQNSKKYLLLYIVGGIQGKFFITQETCCLILKI